MLSGKAGALSSSPFSQDHVRLPIYIKTRSSIMIFEVSRERLQWRMGFLSRKEEGETQVLFKNQFDEKGDRYLNVWRLLQEVGASHVKSHLMYSAC